MRVSDEVEQMIRGVAADVAVDLAEKAMRCAFTATAIPTDKWAEYLVAEIRPLVEDATETICAEYNEKLQKMQNENQLQLQQERTKLNMMYAIYNPGRFNEPQNLQ